MISYFVSADAVVAAGAGVMLAISIRILFFKTQLSLGNFNFFIGYFVWAVVAVAGNGVTL